MDTPIDSPFRVLSQMPLFLLSFLDDAVLLGLSRLGLHWQWLHWLSPVMLGYTLLVWTIRLLKTQSWKQYSLGGSPIWEKMMERG